MDKVLSPQFFYDSDVILVCWLYYIYCINGTFVASHVRVFIRLLIKNNTMQYNWIENKSDHYV